MNTSTKLTILFAAMIGCIPFVNTPFVADSNPLKPTQAQPVYLQGRGKGRGGFNGTSQAGKRKRAKQGRK